MLERFPWRWVQSLHRSIRRTLFTKPKPNTEGIVVRATRNQLLSELGRRSYAPNWEFSYNYKNEDLNLARVQYARHPVRVGANIDWVQDHVRGWRVFDGTETFAKPTWELRAHWEAEPTEHPTAHLKGEPFSREAGMNRLEEILEDADQIEIAE